jgi:hypothetical protein
VLLTGLPQRVDHLPERSLRKIGPRGTSKMGLNEVTLGQTKRFERRVEKTEILSRISPFSRFDAGPPDSALARAAIRSI